jgi:hypothetical protein
LEEEEVEKKTEGGREKRARDASQFSSLFSGEAGALVRQRTMSSLIRSSHREESVTKRTRSGEKEPERRRRRKRPFSFR